MGFLNIFIHTFLNDFLQCLESFFLTINTLLMYISTIQKIKVELKVSHCKRDKVYIL